MLASFSDRLEIILAFFWPLQAPQLGDLSALLSLPPSLPAESLTHAQKAGEILTGLGGHPTMRISALDESGKHSVRDILEESYAHEQRGIEHYCRLVDLTSDKSVFLEEYARSMVAAEEEHLLELRKMLRDLGAD